jgi:hypothetical protein
VTNFGGTPTASNNAPITNPSTTKATDPAMTTQPSVLDREIGMRLRRAMANAGIDGKTMAGLLGRSPVQICRWLTGQAPINAPDAVSVLVTCRITMPGHAPLLRLINDRDHDRSRPMRLTGPDLSDAYRDHIGTATDITEYACLALPLIVHTDAYAREIIDQSVSVPAVGAHGWLGARRHAARLLTHPAPPQLTLIIHEWLLRALLGGTAVMADQLDHLARMSAKAHVIVRVLPTDRAACVAGLPPFGLARYRDCRPVLYRHDSNVLELHDTPADVAHHREILRRLSRAAMDEHESRQLIGRLADQSEPDRRSNLELLAAP